MKYYAVYKETIERVVELNVNSWHEAAAAAFAKPSIKVNADITLDYLGSAANDELDGHWTYTHELMGQCNKCKQYILDGCPENCGARHSGPGGWCSSENCNVFWCCQDCRAADKANDPDEEPLDRLTGV